MVRDYVRIDSKEEIKPKLDYLGNRLGSFWNFDQHALVVNYEPYVDPRTRSQNSLYWQWLGEMATYFSEGMQQFDKDDMHDLMRHKFLGYEDRTLGNTTIRDQLRSTTRLKKLEMSEYMHQIEVWAMEHDCRLTVPHQNEYMKYREAAQ